MKFIDEFRDPEQAQALAEEIRRAVTRPHTLMETCGGQTHAIVRFGIDELLPPEITLVHGPGCPVCVTPVDRIDHAIALARQPDTIVCSFGDMMRVPGTKEDLLSARSDGGDVRMVYAPVDAVRIAEENPDRDVVFFAVGFETTAPANALAVAQAYRKGVKNFSILTAQVRVPPAMEAILSSPETRVEGFLAAGHVCAIMGYWEYEPISAHYGVPIVVTGFEPLDILRGALSCIRRLESGTPEVENAYERAVTREGNRTAQALLSEVFEVDTRTWRGLGDIPDSGLVVKSKYAAHDADHRFGLTPGRHEADTECIAGKVLQGVKKPHECPAFGTGCTPEHPLGAPMVSGEGACAAYYRYRGVETRSAV